MTSDFDFTYSMRYMNGLNVFEPMQSIAHYAPCPLPYSLSRPPLPFHGAHIKFGWTIINPFPLLLLNLEMEFTRNCTAVPKGYHVTVAIHGIGSIRSRLKALVKLFYPSSSHSRINRTPGNVQVNEDISCSGMYRYTNVQATNTERNFY